MHKYLTQITNPDNQRPWAGPDIDARSWAEAQRVANWFGGTVVGVLVEVIEQ